MTTPAFTAQDRPKAILDRSGVWLADSLPSGFRFVKSRQALERNAAPQLHRLTLQSSTRSRAGIATWVSPRLTVLDDRLEDWRQQHPTASVSSHPDRALPAVFNSLFANILHTWSSVELSGLPQASQGPSSVSLTDLFDCLTEHVLPALEHFGEPATLAVALPPSWWSMVEPGTIEWALACGDRTAAASLLRGHMERPLRGQQKAADRLSAFSAGWEHHRRGDDTGGLRLANAQLGWLSAAHDLIDPDELQPATHPDPPN